jgi:hypothetical protein
MTFQDIAAELSRTSELAIALHLGEVRMTLDEGGQPVKVFPQLGGVIMACDGTLLEGGKWGAKKDDPNEGVAPPEETPLDERLAWHAERVAREGEDTPPFHKPLVQGYVPLESRSCTKTSPCEVCKAHGGKKPPVMSKKQWNDHMKTIR